jgi:hypothetical protein
VGRTTQVSTVARAVLGTVVVVCLIVLLVRADVTIDRVIYGLGAAAGAAQVVLAARSLRSTSSTIQE